MTVEREFWLAFLAFRSYRAERGEALILEDVALLWSLLGFGRMEINECE